MTSKVTYLGQLRTECLHIKSQDHYKNDAPTDNNGKGEAFSPTDTVVTALASCMLTVMGIKAEGLGVDLVNTIAHVTKTMGTNPRRIVKIGITIDIPNKVELTSAGFLFLLPTIHGLIQFENQTVL